MTGLSGITVNTTLQQPLPSRFLLTVLDARGDTAVILVNGKPLQVHSEIPLRAGQTLFVSQEQGANGEIRLRLIGDRVATETTGGLPATQPEPGMTLLTALRLVELPVTAENTNKIAALLKTLGGLSLPNLLASAALLETGLSSNQVLDALVSYLNNMLTQQQEQEPQSETVASNDTGKTPTQAIAARLLGLAETLQELAGQSASKQTLGAVLDALAAKSGEIGKQALGGQVFTWTQTTQNTTTQNGHCLYLPLDIILKNPNLRNCELYVYPPPDSESQDKDSQRPWTFTLTLETETPTR